MTIDTPDTAQMIPISLLFDPSENAKNTQRLLSVYQFVYIYSGKTSTLVTVGDNQINRFKTLSEVY